MDTETAAPATARLGSGAVISSISTSAVAAAVGVVVSILIDHLGLALAGWWADRSPVIYHNQVVYRDAGSDLALGGGMVLSLVAGVFFLILYPGSRHHDAARLTMLWVVLHCFRQGFTPLATLPLSEGSNLARAYATLSVPAGLDLVIAAGGLVGLLSVALASAPAFLGYAADRSQIETPARRFGFTAGLAVVGGVAGPLLTVPIFLPDDGTGLIPALPLFGLFTVVTVVAALGTRNLRLEAHRRELGWSWLPLVWLIGFALLSQLLLRRGVVIPPSLSDPLANSL